MSKAFKITILILLAIIIASIGFLKYLDYSDDPLVQANQLRPLDGEKEYKIVVVDYGEGVVPFAYGIIKSGEPEDSGTLAWRLIGESPVDLSDYLNKPVVIKGEYYMGIPLSINEVNLDDQQLKPYFQEQVVIRIIEINSK